MVGDRPASDSRPTCAGVVGRWGGVLPRILCLGVTLLASACEEPSTTPPPAPAPAPAPPAPQPPSAPANLRVSDTGEDFVEWSWSAVEGATGYEAQFSLDSEFTDADDVIDTSAQTTYRRGMLPAGTSFFLRVRAYAGTGDQRLRSAWTFPAPGMTLAPPPPQAPANLRVSASGEDFVEWSWDAVAGAAGYEVQFSVDGEFTGADEVIDTSARTVYRRGGLSAGTSAFLRVRAYVVVGDLRLRSGWSVALPATTLAPLPPQCNDLLDVEFLGRNDAAQTSLGKLTFQALDQSGAVLDFVQPYTILVPDGGANLDIPGLFPTVGVFVSDLRFTREDGWFEQTAMLEWLAELEIRATAAGCEPVEVSCDSFGCASSGSQG